MLSPFPCSPVIREWLRKKKFKIQKKRYYVSNLPTNTIYWNLKFKRFFVEIFLFLSFLEVFLHHVQSLMHAPHEITYLISHMHGHGAIIIHALIQGFRQVIYRSCSVYLSYIGYFSIYYFMCECLCTYVYLCEVCMCIYKMCIYMCVCIDIHI